ncbi:MAG: hypothetical protein A2Y82_02270 [Candidatus Buchananbacteria bacterium RBG_13_36_9]|uniref:Glycosyltransferase RgtA/B/C/D-like domain-containing protein n=1 Tax=Candidatus Buchananbacteria bacterium RBG_13_36_9 TaxID=1797530 RepID=A0A1G1XPQ5_9BACT|nr:MAG: hypothetical protein A2Y82_02270 [Candidatus Buchananbacteria bacterium RBG_13_36_9]
MLNLGLFFINLNDFFVSDDFDWLYHAKTSQHNLGDYFTANYYGEQGVGGSYRPMVNVAFWVNYHVWGLNPLPYHLTNLIFHIGVCFLVYLLVSCLFKDHEQKNSLAILSALFFSILPNHSEAVIWIAAIADPMAAFFYLLSFYGYLAFRQKESSFAKASVDKKFYWLLISVISFVIGLLTKEFVITLPLLILVWELYESLIKNNFRWQDILLKPSGYWVMSIGYLVVRYFSIGLSFGYYAREKFQLDWLKIYKMFAALITDLFFYGDIRVFIVKVFVIYKIFFFLSLFLVLTLICLALWHYKYKLAFVFDAFTIMILPVLFLSYSDTSDGGERYVYLASIMFCVLLSLLVWELSKYKFWKIIILSFLLLYFSSNLLYKNYNWHLAANLSQKIIKQDVAQAIDLTKPDQDLLFVSLPDNLEGAELMRNGIQLAIKLYYPNFEFDSKILGAYIRLDNKNYQAKVLNWAPYPTGGYIAKTADGKNWVTGFDRQETSDYIFELWNYNYKNYTSDTIRLIFKDQDGNFIKTGEEPWDVLIFNEGRLQRLK